MDHENNGLFGLCFRFLIRVRYLFSLSADTLKNEYVLNYTIGNFSRFKMY